MAASITRAELFRFIDRQRLAVQASISPKLAPQAALIGIAVTERLEIIFDTLRSARKYPNLIANPAIALVIGWDGEITLQYQGIAQEIRTDSPSRWKEAYFRKWPDGREREKWPGIAHFAVRPTWMRYSDFASSPPLIREFDATSLELDGPL